MLNFEVFNEVNKMSITNIKLQINPKVLSSKIDGEIILMSTEADSYFGLDPLGSRIWEILSKQPKSSEELVEQLLEEYEIFESTCMAHVQEFLDDMSAKKLIKGVPVASL